MSLPGMLAGRRFSLPTVVPLPPSSDDDKKKTDFDMDRIKASLSIRQDYKKLKQGDRLDRFINNFKKEVLNPFFEDANKENIIDDLSSFIGAQISKGLTEKEAEQATALLVNALAVDIKEVDHFKILSTVGKALLSYFDIVTDILVLIELVKQGVYVMAALQGTSLVISFLLQSFVSYAFGQPLWVCFSGLMGLKPAIESYRDATRAKPYPRQKINNEIMLMACRLIEVVAESIPQAFVQTLALMLYPDKRSNLQYLSLFASFITTGFVVASGDKELDKSKFNRRNEPKLFGYVPKMKGAKTQLAFFAIFCALYKMAKVFSVSMLIATAPSWCVFALFAAEYLGTLLWRKHIDNWRFFQRGLDGVAFSMVAHLIMYFCLLCAPFPVIRIPTMLTPRIYAGSLLYMLLINFILVLLSFRVFGGIDIFTEFQALLGLLVVTVLAFLSCSVAYKFVPKSHRPTFYRIWTFKEHAAQFWWNECAYDFDFNNVITTDQELIRAKMPTWCSPYYAPTDKIHKFYNDNWKSWTDDSPEWFDNKFKSLVPRELLEEMNKKDGAKASFRVTTPSDSESDIESGGGSTIGDTD